MLLKRVYANESDIPEAFKSLYEEKDGKWVLTGVENDSTPADAAGLRTLLKKERDAHTVTKKKLAEFGDLKPEDVTKNLEELEELRLQSELKGDKDDDKKISAIVEERVKVRTASLDRKITDLTKQVGEKDQAITGFQTKEREGEINSEITSAARKLKILDAAVADVTAIGVRLFEKDDSGKIVARDGVGITPGTDVETWLNDQKDRRSYWWPTSVGGGSRGSGAGVAGFTGNNPWHKDHWNMTEQARVYKTLGAEKAAQLASQAGSKVGALAASSK